MKRNLKWIILGSIILIPFLLLIANLVHIKIRMYHLQHLDHSRILSACREAIANRNMYHDDNEKGGPAMGLRGGDVLLLSPIPNDVPEAIRELNPIHVIIYEDYVHINLCLPFFRCGLVGFRPGAKQFGTFKYIDGLWFWNGNEHSTQK
jgi:hypothetical protein